MTSVGYIATFHMAAPTQAAMFMKILLIPARSLPGAGGFALAELCSVRLADTGSGEGWFLHRRLQWCSLSSSNTGTSVYMTQLQNFRCLGLGLLTGGDSRLGVRIPVWPVSLTHSVALAKPVY